MINFTEKQQLQDVQHPDQPQQPPPKQPPVPDQPAPRRQQQRPGRQRLRRRFRQQQPPVLPASAQRQGRHRKEERQAALVRDLRLHVHADRRYQAQAHSHRGKTLLVPHLQEVLQPEQQHAQALQEAQAARARGPEEAQGGGGRGSRQLRQERVRDPAPGLPRDRSPAQVQGDQHCYGAQLHTGLGDEAAVQRPG